MRYALVFVVLFGQSSISRACDKPVNVAELREAGRLGEAAFASSDSKALYKQADHARDDLIPCLKDGLSVQDAAIFHRLMALSAFIGKNRSRALMEYHAARRLEPGYHIPPEVADEGHPLLGLYEDAVRAPDGKPEQIYAPQNGYVLVGGVRNAFRMSETPAIIQVYGPAGVWIETRYIQPREKLPVWGENVFGMTAKDLGIDTTPGWKKPAPWYVAAGVSAAIAITFYSLAMHEKNQFTDPATLDADLSQHRDRANGYGITAVASTVLALTFGSLGVGFQTSLVGENGESP